jgi:hypothetical protein
LDGGVATTALDCACEIARASAVAILAELDDAGMRTLTATQSADLLRPASGAA